MVRSPITAQTESESAILISDECGDVDQGINAALDPLHELVVLSQSFSKAAAKVSTLEFDPMDFDNKVAGQSPTLMSLLISFTRSISHLSLAVLVTDCQFWRLLRLKVPMMVVTKILASVTTGLLIMLPFRHALLTACDNRHFQTILKSQLPSASPRQGLLQSTLQSNL